MRIKQAANPFDLFPSNVWRQEVCKVKLKGKSVDGRRILLPLPPSENNRLIIGRGRSRLVNAPAYRDWLNKASNVLRVKRLYLFSADIEEELFALTVIVYGYKTRDITNYEKPIYDAMQQSERVYVNDRQIKERHTMSFFDKTAPCEYVVCFLMRRADLPTRFDFDVTYEDIRRYNAFIETGAEPVITPVITELSAQSDSEETA